MWKYLDQLTSSTVSRSSPPGSWNRQKYNFHASLPIVNIGKSCTGKEGYIIDQLYVKGYCFQKGCYRWDGYTFMSVTGEDMKVC